MFIPSKPGVADKKECLLEYISIDERDKKLKEKRLTFEVNVEDGDCVEDFKKELAKQETCTVDYFQTDYPNFYIPLDNKVDGYLKFISKLGTLLHFNGGRFSKINQAQIRIRYTDKEAQLTFFYQNKIYKFETVNSCYFLLVKLKEWARVRGCSNDIELFTFTNIKIKPHIADNHKPDEAYKEGHLELLPNSRFSIDGGEELVLKEIEIEYSESIAYLHFKGSQFTLKLVGETNSYKLFYKFSMNDCLDRLQEKFTTHQSCSFDPNLLYYYDQVNIQNPETFYELSGDYEILHFTGNKVEILDMHKRMIDSIQIYYMDLINEEGKQWLLIKGKDATNNFFYTNFLVKPCYDRYERLLK
jgi:hypothetical protein